MSIINIADFADRDIPTIPALVGNTDSTLLTPAGTILLYGSPGVGKSFATLQLCWSLALGIPWLGWRVHDSIKVLYVETEMSPKPAQDRVLSMIDKYGPTRNILYDDDARGYMLSEKRMLQLADVVKENDVKFVMFDPLAQMLPCDENDNVGVAEWTRALDRFRTTADVGIGMVHHPRKGETSGGLDDVRGSGVIGGWFDSAARMTAVGSRVEVRWDKTRNAREMPPTQWLQRDRSCGILEPAGDDPWTVALELLSESPVWLDKDPETGNNVRGFKKLMATATGLGMNKVDSTIKDWCRVGDLKTYLEQTSPKGSHKKIALTEKGRNGRL